jgi:signal transduction histidine kinase
MFSIGRSSALTHTVVVSLTMLVLWGWLPEFVLFWGLLMLALTVALATLSLTYTKVASDPLTRNRYGILHSIVVAAIGTTWGGGAWIVAGSSDEFLLFYTFVLGGTALGAVSTQHSLLRSCMLSVWTSIPLLSLALAILGPESFGSALAVLVLFFGITLTVTAVRMNRFLSNSITLSAKLHDKVGELTALSKELEEARRKAEHADQSKTELLAQASHDLRHPVHAIGLLVEMLRSRSDDQESHKIIDNIGQSVDSMARLFRSLLDMSALDLGRIQPTIAALKTDQLLSAVVGQAVEANTLGRLRYVPCREWIRSDQALLQTIIQNLVNNALKYGEGADVLLGCRRRSGKLSIEVHDNGPGIPVEDQQRIFTPFVRLSPLNLGHGEGLGLGLAIVKRMVDLLGLTLEVDSTPGKGTIMRLGGLEVCAPAKTGQVKNTCYKESLFDSLQVYLVGDTAGAVQVQIDDWGCQSRSVSCLSQVAEDADFILLDASASHSSSTLVCSSLPSDAVLAVVGDVADWSTFPESVYKLAQPVKPLQLRSLLLTAASLKRALAE